MIKIAYRMKKLSFFLILLSIIVASCKGIQDPPAPNKVQPTSQVEITELKFIGDNLNPLGTGIFDTRTITYSADTTKPPLLSEIKEDGSTKIGSTKSFELEVWVMFKDETSQEKTLKVENTTNKKTVTTTEIKNKALQTKIPLKNGENTIVITYSEKDKKPVSYSVKVDYEEPEYEPIYKLEINGIRYNNKTEQDKLIAGTETIDVEGASKLPIKIGMKEIWYKDEGWTLKIDEQEVSKDTFEKIGTIFVQYDVNTSANLTVNGKKEVKISFENPSRSYSVTYKITVNHKLFHKLKDLIVIEEKISNYISSHNFKSFEKDANKSNQFNLRRKIQTSDWASNVLFLLDIENENITPKYVILTEKKEAETIQASEWQEAEKKTLKYKNKESIEKEGYVAKAKIEHGSSYLYVLLEGDGAKIFYTSEIVRAKEKEDEVGVDNSNTVFLHADDENNILENRHPAATKIIAKIRPKNPRAKVKILEPEQKDLILNADGAYFEYAFPFKGKVATLKYKVIAENGLKESREKTNTSFINPAISEVKFGYKENAYGTTKANIKEKEYYIPVEKNRVKENKIYLHLKIVNGLEISSNNLGEARIREDHTPTPERIYIVDVSSASNGNIQEYGGNITYNNKTIDVLKIHLFKAIEDIKEIKVSTLVTTEFPNNEYELTKAMNVNGENVFIFLHKADNETKDNTKQKVVVSYNSEERELEITEDNSTKSLKCTFKDLKLPKGVDATLIIKYFKNKDDASAIPAEYKLKINNRKA